MQAMKSTKAKHVYSVLIITILTSLVYFPGLSDFWLADDRPNIIANQALKIDSLDTNSLLAAATSNNSGPLKRPISSLSFGLNYYFSGKQFDASDFKITNLAIHIVNGVLVYAIAFFLIIALKRSTAKDLPVKTLALFIALAWALHPIQLTAVLYPVQRMTSLSGMFVFAGLLLFIIGRLRLAANQSYALILMYLGIGLGTLFGALSKENALLLPYLAVAIELTIFSQLVTTDKRLHARATKIFYATTAVIPATAALLYLATHPGIVTNGYMVFPFSLPERLMTEARVLFMYLGQMFYPAPAQFVLSHDTLTVSKGLLQPWTTLIAALGILLLAGTSLLKRKAYPLLSFAVLWFLAAHAMESTVFPLRLMYEHRNYVASFGIIFTAIYCIFLISNMLSTNKLIRLVPAIIISLCLALATYTRSEIWSSYDSLSSFDVKNYPNSAIAHSNRAKHLIKTAGSLSDTYEHLRAAVQLNPLIAVPLITMTQLHTAFQIGIENNAFAVEETSATPENYYAPLKMNGDYIKKLRPLVSTELESRLRNNMGAETISVLATAITAGVTNKCRINGPCEELITDALKWSHIVLQNKASQPLHKAIIYNKRSQLLIYLGDYRSALSDLDKAYQVMPDKIYLLFQKLALLMALRDLEKAETLINTIEAHPAFSTLHHEPLTKAKSDLSFLKQRQNKH